VAAALGASLVAMVAELTQGRAKYADHAELCEVAKPAAQALSDELLQLADDDAAAYAACAFALKLPRESFTDQELRDRQIRETATVAAVSRICRSRSSWSVNDSRGSFSAKAHAA